jgi:hypothetical protein
MRVPIFIDHRDLERQEICYYDEFEKAIRCGDYDNEYEYEVDEVEFDLSDLEDIIDQYFDDITDIILHDKKLLNKLLKKLNSVLEKNS